MNVFETELGIVTLMEKQYQEEEGVVDEVVILSSKLEQDRIKSELKKLFKDAEMYPNKVEWKFTEVNGPVMVHLRYVDIDDLKKMKTYLECNINNKKIC